MEDNDHEDEEGDENNNDDDDDLDPIDADGNAPFILEKIEYGLRFGPLVKLITYTSRINDKQNTDCSTKPDSLKMVARVVNVRGQYPLRAL